MKTTKRILALLLALLVVGSFTVSAFAQTVDVAAGENSITVKNATIGEQYSIYKIFDAVAAADGSGIVYKLPATADVTNDTFFNTYFSVDGDGFVTAQDGLTETVLKGDEFKAWVADFADKVSGPVEATEGTLTFANVPQGYYYVESTLGAVLTVDSTKPDVELVDKNQGPDWNEDSKSITQDTANADGSHTILEVDANSGQLNETVNFSIKIDATNYNGDQKIFQYVIVDTMDNGMTYTSEPVVKVDGADPSGDVAVTYYDKDGNVTTELAAAQRFRIIIDWTEDGTKDTDHLYANAALITVRYPAKLDPAKVAAVDYVAGNTNTATFTWLEGDDDPDDPPDPDDPNPPEGWKPSKSTETYVTEIEITKKANSADGPILTGAEFTLTGPNGTIIYSSGTHYVEDANGTYWLLKDGSYTETAPVATTATTNGTEEFYEYPDGSKMFKKEDISVLQGADQNVTDISAFVNSEGKVVFKGLTAGEYTLTETVTPENYNTIQPITFTVAFDKDATPKFSITETDSEVKFQNNHLELTVVNKGGNELPSTGGIGTTIFYITGSALLLGAFVLLVTKKRMASHR